MNIDPARYEKVRRRVEIALVASKIAYTERNGPIAKVDVFLRQNYDPSFSNRKWVALTKRAMLDTIQQAKRQNNGNN